MIHSRRALSTQMLDTLSHYGYKPCNPQEIYSFKGEPVFRADLEIQGVHVGLRLHFQYGDSDYPLVCIENWQTNPSLRKALGHHHVDSEGTFCVIDKSRVWWDSANSPGFTASFCEKIEALLQEKLKGEVDDRLFFLDFPGYWDYTCRLHVGCDLQHLQPYVVKAKNETESNNALLWVTPFPPDSESTLPRTEKFTPNALCIHLSNPIVPSGEMVWPPSDAKGLFSWLTTCDRRIGQRIFEALRRHIFTKGTPKRATSSESFYCLLTAGQEPKSLLGCAKIVLEPLVVSAIRERRVGNALRILLANNSDIEKSKLVRADPSYIQTRNSKPLGGALKDKKVLLLGAGAVGGYAAKILSSHGAGWGGKGKLTICDHDELSVENISRHLLGATQIGEKKAEALADRVRCDTPYLTVIAVASRLTNAFESISNFDLVIDATGSSTVGIQLARMNSESESLTPIIHSWIYGQGLAVQSLITTATSGGCYRCLWHGETYEESFTIARGAVDDDLISEGCDQSFYPYLATASMAAASLLGEQLHDYLEGREQPNLRVKILREDLCQNRASTHLKRKKRCPVCAC